MIKSDFSTPIPTRLDSVHFVGIGGAGMSGIAAMFHEQGIAVTGSDSREGATVDSLRERGIPVAIGHDAANVGEVDALVVTGAISESNPEYLAARERGIPALHRAQALAWLTRDSRLVAVAGAHGKTTSTAMLVSALLRRGAAPSFVNGGVIRELGTSAAHGEGEIFVVEADESDGSFLLYDTAVALITNVDPDHLDHFGSREAFEQAFVRFAETASEFVVISADDPGARGITSRLSARRVLTFGMSENADVRIHAVDTGPQVAFTLSWAGEEHRVTLAVAGLHNALNAAGAFAVLVGLGFDAADSIEALSHFAGAERRFEFRGEVGGVRVFDDFAHHPTEVEAALSGARGVVGTGRLIPVFQPHLFTRTQDMAQEFADTLERLADHTIVVPIYPARQEPIPGVTGRLITERFSDASVAQYIEDWSEAVEYAASIARPGDILIPMGGGDIHLIIPQLLAALERNQQVDETA
ncbi:UDP-N-acetylmuramate--L-alanine ligase [Salinibacterium sp. dk2585]|uniref:UDP-N-acetylmuramate--L-alanine ligase n=1 Tax=unclassified Salinibacterium TaxID=2632331 RepID=UPI0011C244E0|nr:MULTISPECIES: UDP-N-acetylmuramate--L-alanine ligase [unclassified Salinibacterium]QEE61120.1 UDP-N-acetylmuramate--L-alanine ligase [Salinibacterium sp. dk2585]TXK53063.1 UDP-N-acetylmuramate--L-alanine ligase [Salinibacterium sp. dk5596]